MEKKAFIILNLFEGYKLVYIFTDTTKYFLCSIKIFWNNNNIIT